MISGEGDDVDKAGPVALYFGSDEGNVEGGDPRPDSWGADDDLVGILQLDNHVVVHQGDNLHEIGVVMEGVVEVVWVAKQLHQKLRLLVDTW